MPAGPIAGSVTDTGRLGSRFEKEFEGVNDVFELQVMPAEHAILPHS